MNICLFTQEEIDKPLKAADPRAQHIKKILHKGVGDTFAAGIIEGQAGTATITNADDDITFAFAPQSDGKPLFPLHMIIGFPRPIQLKRLLRDMAALGVASVRLCGTELGEKSYLKASLSDPQEVYKMLLDGTVQAASTHVPMPFVYQTLAECLDELESEAAQPQTDASQKNAVRLESVASQKSAALKLALDNVEPRSSLRAFLQDNPPQNRPVFAAIGSERGWSPAERSMLESRGFVRLGMGSRVMRTETAATVSASVVLDAMGALG
ncbi:MAG: RNA methyltransferase [Treponema sp.]|nr:RNA methyltransferase [Treponema sp.]